MEGEPRDGIARGSSGVLRADDPAAAKRPIIATPRLNLADLLSASRRLDVRASRFENRLSRSREDSRDQDHRAVDFELADLRKVTARTRTEEGSLAPASAEPDRNNLLLAQVVHPLGASPAPPTRAAERYLRRTMPGMRGRHHAFPGASSQNDPWPAFAETCWLIHVPTPGRR